MCVACRTSRPKRELQRVVRTPGRDVVFDPTGRLAGRGAYVCQGTACLELAIKKGALSRALDTPLPAAFLNAVTSRAITKNTQGVARGQE
jgi:predicted RNA-binding protein YlxR (DUF448 family)